MKPLLSLAGLPLIERTILTAQAAGLDDFSVVTGYEAERVEQFLEDLGRRRNVKLTAIRNDEWETKGNGASVLKAQRVLNENFVLLMADHIFDEATLSGLMRKGVAEGEILLAADFNLERTGLVELDDVTKVASQDGAIVDIGKDLERYDAYDTGMFVCSPAIFRALEESSQSGDTSLSAGVRALARKGKAKVFDIEGRYWLDVDTPADRKRAEKLLYRSLGKPRDGWISRHINRKFSTWFFTPLILNYWPKATPNQVSLLSAAVGLLASLSFFFHLPLMGGILIQLASILDGSDGEIARLKKMQSPFGGFFDAVLDRYADSFILFGMFYYVFTAPKVLALLGALAVPLILAVSMLAIFGNLMVSYTSTKSVTDFGYRYRGRLIAAGRGRDLRLFVLAIGGILAGVHPLSVLLVLLVVAVLTNAIVLKRLAISWNYAQSRNPLLGAKLPAIIFDFDGTLANTMPFLTELAVNLMVENYDLDKDTARRQYRETTGLPFARQLERIFPGHPQNAEVSDTFEARKREGVLAHPFFPEAFTTLAFFKSRGIKCFVCTSTAAKMLAEYVKRHQLRDLADDWLGYEPDFGKDRQIASLLAEHGLEPHDVLFVGDSLTDGTLAKDSKVRFIGIRRLFDEDAFRQHGLVSVQDLAALTRLWEESEDLRQAVKKVC